MVRATSAKLPGFVCVDAALYVKINETWRDQLNIENIFGTLELEIRLPTTRPETKT